MSSTVAISNFPAYAAVIGVAGVVAVPVLAHILKKFPRLSISAVVHTIVVGLSAAISLAQYIIQLHSQSSLAVPVGGFLSIYGISQLVYKYGKYAQPYLGRFSSVFAKKSASTPSDTANAVVDATVEAFTAPAVTASEVAPTAPTEFNA